MAALSAAGSYAPHHARPADVAVVIWTGGSEGHPKGVLHTHRGLAAKARAMVDIHALRPDDVVLMPAPLAHISGLLNGVLVPGAAGMRTVFMERWDPERALATIEQELHGLFVTGGGCISESGFVALGPDIRVGAVFEEEANGLGPAGLRGGH